MRKKIIQIALLHLSLVLFSACTQRRNFFEDSDDPGLSRLTSRGYDIVTLYLNDSAYINPYEHHYLGGSSNSKVAVEKIPTNSDKDTLSISWEIHYAAETDPTVGFYDLSLLIPVPKTFNQNDFQVWEGKRLPYDVPLNVTLRLNRSNSSFNAPDTGAASIYFLKISPSENQNSTGTYLFSGIFEGSAGNNRVTKGRFDFFVDKGSLNF